MRLLHSTTEQELRLYCGGEDNFCSEANSKIATHEPPPGRRIRVWSIFFSRPFREGSFLKLGGVRGGCY